MLVAPLGKFRIGSIVFAPHLPLRISYPVGIRAPNHIYKSPESNDIVVRCRVFLDFGNLKGFVQSESGGTKGQ